MSKKSFRSRHKSPEPYAEYPTWSAAGSRRSFLATLGQAAAGGVLASLALACGDGRAVPVDGGPQDPRGDAYHPPHKDQGAAPMMDVPRPPPSDVGPPGPDTLGGMPDQAPAPPDMWPHFSDGLPPSPTPTGLRPATPAARPCLRRPGTARSDPLLTSP